MLEIEAVDVFYGRIQALRDVSLKLEEGEVYTIIGANGAGKTTLMRAIIGLKKISGGRIRFMGEDISNESTFIRARRGMSMVPEGRGLFPDFTVKENLLVGAFPRSDRDGIAEDLTRVFEVFPRLEERQNQRGKTLSGGEGQMLAIGRSLMARPKVLLMDEPSMGLMPIIVTEIFRVIELLREQGVTILLAEQNAYKALTVAEKGGVLELGRLVLQGEAKALMDEPLVKRAYLGG